MNGRTARLALCVGLLTLLPGCVELTQTITLNPDGRGKMKLDIITAAYDFNFDFTPDGKGAKKKKSLDEIKREAVVKFLGEAPGVTAFKDIKATWMRDGKLHVTATAYFDRLEDLDKADNAPKQPGMSDPASSFRCSFKTDLSKKGAMRITARNKGVSEVKPIDDADGPADLSKMTDKELDEYLLAQRVEYQKLRPLMEMMFNDLKITVVLHVPGDVVEAKGFKKDGKHTVSQVFEGKTILGVFKKFVMMDAAEVKKVMATRNEKDLMSLLGPLAAYGEPDVSVQNLGGPLFDYDKEVREARAAYPALRKALGLDANVKLPGE
jgi:hypothetical protein